MWVAQMTAANDTLQRCDSLQSSLCLASVGGWGCTTVVLQLELHINELKKRHCHDALAAVLSLLGTTLSMATLWLAC